MTKPHPTTFTYPGPQPPLGCIVWHPVKSEHLL